MSVKEGNGTAASKAVGVFPVGGMRIIDRDSGRQKAGSGREREQSGDAYVHMQMTIRRSQHARACSGSRLLQQSRYLALLHRPNVFGQGRH